MLATAGTIPLPGAARTFAVAFTMAMTVPMRAALVSFFVVRAIGVRLVFKSIRQKRVDCRVRVPFDAGVQLYVESLQRTFRAFANSAADHRVDFIGREKARKSAAAGAVRRNN